MSVSAVDSKSAELVGRLDRLPFSRWHKNLFTLCFLGVMFDACDFALFGMALPPVAREFGLNQAQAGLLATVGLVGAFLGALFWGTISDYIGRRTSFSATIVTLSGKRAWARWVLKTRNIRSALSSISRFPAPSPKGATPMRGPISTRR